MNAELMQKLQPYYASGLDFAEQCDLIGVREDTRDRIIAQGWYKIDRNGGLYFYYQSMP